MANNCSREEDQFKSMPMSAATFMVGKMEALGACYRTIPAFNLAEDYLSSSVRMQLIAKSQPKGIYGVGTCMEGFAKGDADSMRVVGLSSDFRALQQSASAMTGQSYEAKRMATKLYASECHHEQEQIYKWPSVAAAMCRY